MLFYRTNVDNKVMLGKPKQQRSQDRINKILDAAELILEQGALSAVTIAKSI